jgi:hypothetical protein
MVERMLNQKLKTIQTDWGGEYQRLHSFFNQQGILHRLSCPHTHQQNSCVERKHRHIIETSLALVADSSVPKFFWDEACQTSCYLINRMPTLILGNLSHFEKLNKKPPYYNFLRIFGCACFPYLRSYNQHKYELRSKECDFLGYSSLHKGYKCFHVPTQKYYISRDIVFDENVFPYAVQPKQSSTMPIQSSTISLPIYVLPSISTPSTPIQNSAPSSSQNPISNLAEPNVATTSNLSQLPRAHPMTTRTQRAITKPRRFTDGTVRYPIPRALIATSYDPSLQEPTCFSTAVKIPEWQNAMQQEFNASLQNQPWSLVPHSAARNIVGCKWVFKLKRKVDGSIERHKARLVAKGFHQQEGVDFGETYSPVLKPTTIRTVLSVTYSAGWSIRQIDTQNAFLHGFLFEEVFMTRPPGFSDPDKPSHVCKLQKAIYGLKQAPRAWFSQLANKLIDLGFIGSQADSSLFTFKSESVNMFILIYVDNIIITASKSSAIDDLLQ